MAEKTVRRLFAMSGNKCAFPECSTPLIEAGGTIVGEIGHIRAQSPGGPRFDGAQTEDDRHAYEDLVLLCGSHHKIIDAQSGIYSVDVLESMKAVHEGQVGRAERDTDGIFARLLLNAAAHVEANNNTGNVVVSSPGAVVGGIINIRTPGKRPTFHPAEGMIGAAGNESRYIQYLIRRYNEFASKEPSRSTKFNHGAIRKNIESEFRVPWQAVSIERFADLCLFLQRRIGRTRIAKSNASKGYRSFSTFQEFVEGTKHKQED